MQAFGEGASFFGAPRGFEALSISEELAQSVALGDAQHLCMFHLAQQVARLSKGKWFRQVFKARHDFALAGDVFLPLEHMALGQFKMPPEHAAGSSASVNTVDEIE